MRRECAGAIALLVVSLLAAPAAAQVAFVKIEGDPLTIHVGEDLSFQIFNAEVPGSGQIFPTSCENTADMGVFAEIDGTLFSPDFSNHGCGTATGSLGERTPWTPISLSDIDGAGTVDDPWRVTAVVAAANTAVQVRMVVSYVSGQNFFRIKQSIISFQRSRAVKVWNGADIYLASSDAGVFHLEESLGAPGGNNCTTPVTYSILLIPATTADSIAGAQFAEIWRQIGVRDLDNMIIPAGCIDNGAAIQWNRSLVAGQAASIKSAVSFGAIPSAANFQLLTIRVAPPVEAINGETIDFGLDIFPDEDLNADVDLWVGELPEGFTASLSPSHIAAPGFGTSVLTVQVGNDVLPGDYYIPIHGEVTGEPGFALAKVTVVCDPPMILGDPDDQPASQTVTRGSAATLSVTMARPGVFSYQWYQGHSGSMKFPIQGATSSTYTTPSITTETSFWVRVSNACGSTDSWTAVVSPSGTKGRPVPRPRKRGVARPSSGGGNG